MVTSRLLGYLPGLVRQQPRPAVPEVVLDDVQVLDADPGLGPPLPVVLILRPGLRRRRLPLPLRRLRRVVRARLYELVLVRVCASLLAWGEGRR